MEHPGDFTRAHVVVSVINLYLHLEELLRSEDYAEVEDQHKWISGADSECGEGED
jgi:hypothetical protein